MFYILAELAVSSNEISFVEYFGHHNATVLCKARGIFLIVILRDLIKVEHIGVLHFEIVFDKMAGFHAVGTPVIGEHEDLILSNSFFEVLYCLLGAHHIFY